MKTRIIPIFIPHLGCPFQCLYCNQKKQTGREILSDVRSLDIRSTAERYLFTFPDDINHVEIGFFGGTFTGLNAEIQKLFLSQAEKVMENHPRIKGIRISTHPLLISPPVLILLKRFPVKVIELGIQSFDDTVLMKSGRMYSAEKAIESSLLIKENGFQLGLQLMTGLPFDSEQISYTSALKACRLLPECIRIYPCIVFKNTPLERHFKEGKYTPPFLEETIVSIKKLLLLFHTQRIPVIRVGIHPVKNIGDILAGPYHPSLRALCEQALRFDLILSLIEKSCRSLEIHCPAHQESYFRGQKNANISRLREMFPSCDFSVVVCHEAPFVIIDKTRKVSLPFEALKKDYERRLFLNSLSHIC